MQVLSVEPWNDNHDVFACRIILEPWEDHDRLANVIARSRSLDTMRVSLTLLLQAQDELDAYKRLPELVSKGEDYALRYRS